MDVTITKAASQALGDQRKGARAFHRVCASEGFKNILQAASMHLPIALLADFPLAIGLAMDMAVKLAAPKERHRLRELGRAELSTMGIIIIEEERAQIDVVLDAMPSPGAVKSVVGLGLKRVRKDVSGRRFAGLASPLRVSALVAQLGGRLTVLEKEQGPVERGSDGQLGVAPTVDASGRRNRDLRRAADRDRLGHPFRH